MTSRMASMPIIVRGPSVARVDADDAHVSVLSVSDALAAVRRPRS